MYTLHFSILSLLIVAHGITSLPLDFKPQIPISILSTSSNRNISTSIFNDLEEFARIVDITYCVGTSDIQKPFSCLSRCDNFPTFELIKTWSTGPLLSDSSGYMALDHNPLSKRLIVAFRGTYSIANTIADLSALPQKYVPYSPGTGAGSGNGSNEAVWISTSLGDQEESHNLRNLDPSLASESTNAEEDDVSCANCTVHAGFLGSWQNARDIIMPSLLKTKANNVEYEVHIVGHSLGGAVSLLAALELRARGWRPIVTTFGEPRVGNQEFASYVDRTFSREKEAGGKDEYRRVTHADDPVVLLPPAQMGYRPHGNEIFISKHDLPPSPEDLEACEGNHDEECSAQGNAAMLWQLFFAHRDYFWRLGVCLKGGDPFQRWKGSYPHDENDDIRGKSLQEEL